MSRARNMLGFLSIAVAGVVLDQATKAWARAARASGRIPVLPGILDFVLVKNTGAASRSARAPRGSSPCLPW